MESAAFTGMKFETLEPVQLKGKYGHIPVYRPTVDARTAKYKDKLKKTKTPGAAR